VVDLVFSESVSPSKVSAAVAITKLSDNTQVTWSLLNTGGSALTIGLKAVAGIPATDKLRIAVGSDVGAPSAVMLDGAYDGKPGSGPFVVELVPADGKWEPQLAL